MSPAMFRWQDPAMTLSTGPDNARYVLFKPRNVFTNLMVIVGVLLLLWLVWIAKGIVILLVFSAILALALNPTVAWLQRRGAKRRGRAVAIVFLVTFGVLASGAWLVIPPLIRQVTEFIDAVPGYVHDLTKGQGPFGFLETKYHVVERARQAVAGSGGAKLLTHAGVVVSIGKGIVTFVTTSLTVTFMTLFMLLEGPAWVERFYKLLPAASQPRFRALGDEIYRAVGGSVIGNVLISIVCGVIYGVALWLLGVKYVFALAFVGALFDLVPMVGATVAGVIICGVAFVHSTTAGIVMIVVVFVYQQAENHILQPLIYSRTVALSPLTVLVAILVGATAAGLIGVIAAIPIAGAIQVVLRDVAEQRRQARLAGDPSP
jgi:predicted PurR-regulated permease PerM